MTPRRRQWIVLGAVAFVALVVWVLWPPSEKPYYDMVAALRAAGEPVDFDGLVAGDVPVDGDDGGPELGVGDQWLKDNVTGERWEQVVGPWNSKCEADWPETSTPEQMAELAKFLVEIEPGLAHARTAATKPRIRFRHSPRDAFGFPEPTATLRLQHLQRPLIATAIGASDETARLDALVCIATLATHTECAQSIDHLVAAALAASVAHETRRQLESGRLGAAAARARLDPLLRERWLGRMPAVLRSQRAFIIQAYRTVLDGTFPYSEPFVPRPTFLSRLKELATTGKLSKTLIAPGMAAEVVADCDSIAAALRVPCDRSPGYRAAVMSAIDTVAPGARRGSEIAVTFPRMAERLCRTDAATRLTRIALAAAEHRAKTGDFPASLDELKPMFPDGVPLDPFTDAPFDYARTATGVRIASVGRLPDEPALDEAMLRERCLVWELKR